MVLPDWLRSRYYQYKNDTGIIASWIANAAKSLGYEDDAKPGNGSTPSPSGASSSASASAGRPKGKGRKGGGDTGARLQQEAGQGDRLQGIFSGVME